jgi:hypothetical protein
MFKFGFNIESASASATNEVLVYESSVLSENKSIIPDTTATTITIEEVLPQEVVLSRYEWTDILDMSLVKSKPLVDSESGQEFDIIAGVYEGGFTVWEGSIDLCRYLLSSDVCFNDCTVLELGCGAGIPGIQALRLGASLAVFSDFNKSVLIENTWPNIINNLPHDHTKAICVAGDWCGLPNYIVCNNQLRYVPYNYLLLLFLC